MPNPSLHDDHAIGAPTPPVTERRTAFAAQCLKRPLLIFGVENFEIG